MRAQSGESHACLSLSSAFGRLVAMRRLHQVILAAVAIASLLGFLLYKHEYDRLSNLLQVLNTFGADTASARGFPPDGDDAPPPSHDASLGVWQQVENVYVYSAFLEAGTAATVIGVVPSSVASKDVGVAKCLFWYDAVPMRPRYADLAVRFVDEESQESWRMVSLSCVVPGTASSNGGRPYAVSLLSSTQPEPSAANLPQILLQEAAAPSANNVSLAVCTVLRSPHTDPVLLTQFVKFHRKVGATRFTFYNLGISPKIQNRIQALGSELSDLEVRLLTWNFPFEFTEAEAPLTSRVLRSDCLARHTGASYVLFAPISTLVVPVYHSHVTNLLQDEDVVGDHHMGQMQLKQRVFCTELESNPYTKTLGATVWPMYLKTAWVEISEPGSQNDFFLVKPSAVRAVSASGAPKLKKDFLVRDVEEDIAVVHSYRNCSPHSVASAKYDNSMMRRFLTQIE